MRSMPSFIYISPLLAVALSQLGDTPSGLAVYGPIGLVCLLLVYREEKSKNEIKAERDAVREDNSKLREEMRALTHQVRNLSRNLLYAASTHGTENLRKLAELELERLDSSQNNTSH